MNIRNPFAVITGASQGIGAEYARALAVRKYDLLLVSRNARRLDQLAKDLQQQYEVSVRTESLDLSDSDAAQRLYAVTQQQRSEVDLLVNNAGFGFYGAFINMPQPEIRDMLQLHIVTIVESIRLFLPDMVKRGSGAIINIASIAGMLPLPYMAEYAATKAFLISFSEALATEVRSSGIQIQACCPGQTETEFHKTAGFQPESPFRTQSAQEVVLASLKALNRRTPVVTIGWQGKMAALCACWLPHFLLLRAAAQKTNPRHVLSGDHSMPQGRDKE